ncbi:MAG: tRNA (guanine(46)-N(7))-methyltransferase TrmB [Beijerinckiaceae bacterium]
MTSDPTPERERFFGRSKGKTIRQGQAAILADGLARFAIRELEAFSLDTLFDQPMRGYRLEIGFGGGEHLVHRAMERPDIGFIGVEPFVNGMAKLMVEVERHAITNIRVFSQDATLLLRRLPVDRLEEVSLLYPDPWPKRRQRKRRFVTEESLALIARALKPGCPFRFASDIDDYVGWTLTRALGQPMFAWEAMQPTDWTTPYPGWPGTRYEAKALREGRTPAYLTFVRR